MSGNDMAIVSVHYPYRESEFAPWSSHGTGWRGWRIVYEDTDTATRLLFVEGRPAGVRLGGRFYVTDAPIPNLGVARAIREWLADEKQELRWGRNEGAFSSRLIPDRKLREIARTTFSSVGEASAELFPPGEIAFSDEQVVRLYYTSHHTINPDLGVHVEWWEATEHSTSRGYPDNRRGILYRFDIPPLGTSVAQELGWVDWTVLGETRDGEDATAAAHDPALSALDKFWLYYDVISHYGIDNIDSYPLEMRELARDWRWWE